MRTHLPLVSVVGLVLLVGLVSPPQLLRGQIPDTVAHPIQIGCNPGQGPLGYVLELSGQLGLTDHQREAILGLEEGLARENRPLGERWWALKKEGGVEGIQASRAEILSALRETYKEALASLRTILTEEQWARALEPPFEMMTPGVRCLARSVLVLIPGEPNGGDSPVHPFRPNPGPTQTL